MPATITIQHLTRKEIDVEKWNNCIAQSSNGLIYAYGYYLDAMCTNWDAFIWEDYNSVMALPWRKKGGIKYTYSVPFVQQLGIIGNQLNISYPLLLKEIKKLFRYGDIFFNYSNLPALDNTISKTNFILDINKPYEELALHFSSDLKKNLQAAKKYEFFLSGDYSYDTAIDLFKKNYQSRITHVSEDSYKNFSSLCRQLYDRQMVFTRTVENKGKEILAIALLLKDNKRIYNLMNTTTAEGKRLKANHFLLNEIIKEFCETRFLFDFEGSDLPGVKEFYRNFGPVNQPYFHYHFNSLPFPFNLIKK